MAKLFMDALFLAQHYSTLLSQPYHVKSTYAICLMFIVWYAWISLNPRSSTSDESRYVPLFMFFVVEILGNIQLWFWACGYVSCTSYAYVDVLVYGGGSVVLVPVFKSMFLLWFSWLLWTLQRRNYGCSRAAPTLAFSVVELLDIGQLVDMVLVLMIIAMVVIFLMGYHS